MGWFWQIAIQGGFFGLLVAGALFAPWTWLKILLSCAALYILLMLFRNPAFTYRRLFRVVIMATIACLLADFRLSLSGQVPLPDGGHLKLALDVLSGIPIWVLLPLALLCLIGDMAVSGWEAKRRAELAASLPDEIRLWTRPDGGITLRQTITLIAPAGGMTLGGARVRIGGLWPAAVPGKLYAHRPGRPLGLPVRSDSPLGIGEHQNITLTFEAEIGSGVYARLLAFQGTFLRFAPFSSLSAALHLVGAPARALVPILFRLRFQSTAAPSDPIAG
jgi:hypothetical protein